MKSVNFKLRQFMVAALAVAIIACEKPQQESAEQAPADSQQSADQQQTAAPETASTGQFDRGQIEEIAQKEISGGKIFEGQVEHENGMVTYELGLRNESGIFEIEINAATGEIIEREDVTAQFESEGKTLPAEIPDLTVRDAAEQAALATTPGETIEWKLKDGDSGPVYSFTIRTNDGSSRKVRIAAGTNEVISQE